MSKPDPDALRDAAPVQGGPVLDYERRGGGRADGERPRATAGHILAALIVAGLAFVGALVGGMALATLLPDDGSDHTLFVAARPFVFFLSAAAAVSVFVFDLRSYARAALPPPIREWEPDEQELR